MRKLVLTTVIFGLLGLGTTNANEEFDKKKAEVQSQVATNFFDPGPSVVMKVLQKIEYYGYIDLGINLTSLTEYQVGDILFSGGYKSTNVTVTVTNVDKSYDSLVQSLILRDIRRYFANPQNLEAVYSQVKSVAIPALLQKVGPTRANTWLAPAEDLFTKSGFNPAFGKYYEEWRDGGCQWYLQVSPDQGYTPKLSRDECAGLRFIRAMGSKQASGFVNKAHWYGFLWRRYLEGDTGLVAVWQGILSDINKAAHPQSSKRS